MERHTISCEQCGLHLEQELFSGQRLLVQCELCHKTISSIPSEEETVAKTVSYSNKRQQRVVEIDGYRIVRKIGEGALGKVFLACHLQTREALVFKILKIEILKEEEQGQLIDYFIREAHILSGLKHRYIAEYRGCGNFQGKPYLKMEFVEGDNLQQKMKQGRLPLVQAIKTTFHIAGALQYGIENNVVHRDIKPANIILTADNTPKLIDFGMAKILGDHYYKITRTGMVIGTPYYMPREQVLDAKNADHRSDIYSLGATLYHMIAGIPPFHERSPDGFMGVLSGILENRLVPLASLRPNLPQEICDIVARAMDPEPDNRYQQAIELRNALKMFITGGKN